MSLIGAFFGKLGLRGATKAVKTVGGVLDNLFTSDEERLEADRLVMEIEQRPQQAQWDINRIEAQSFGRWSWRNGVGWVGALSLAFYFIPQYVLGAAVWAKQAINVEPIDGIITLPPYPVSADGLMELVIAMLGLAGKVAYERVKGVRPRGRSVH